MNSTPQRERLTLTEATARLVYLMMLWDGITSAEAERQTGYSRRGVLRIFNAASRVIPITYDPRDQKWKVVDPVKLRDYLP